MDESRAYQRTETEDKVKQLKKRYISSASLSNKSTKIQQPIEIKFMDDKFRSDTPIVSSMSIHGASITTVSPDKYRIPRKIKKENFRIFNHRKRDYSRTRQPK